MRVHPAVCILIGLLFVVPPPLRADDIVLELREAPRSEIVLLRLDLTAAAQHAKVDASEPSRVRVILPTGQSVPAQFIPAPDYDARARVTGILVVRWPATDVGPLRLRFDGKAASGSENPWDGVIKTPHYTVRHDPEGPGGFPSRIEFGKTATALDSFHWNDRLHHRQQGSFVLRGDRKAEVRRVSIGPLCQVVRTRARYVQGVERYPESRPRAVYDWYYFAEHPLVFVSTVAKQDHPFGWDEQHFLELSLSGKRFPGWVGGEPLKRGEFKASNTTTPLVKWGAIVDGRDTIGILRGGVVLVHDAASGAGRYLHAHGDTAWRGWSTQESRSSSWLWLGSTDDPAGSMRRAGRHIAETPRATVTLERIRSGIRAARAAIPADSGAGVDPGARAERLRRLEACALAEILEDRGALDAALRALKHKLPESWRVLRAGVLTLVLELVDGGAGIVGLIDTETGRSLLTRETPPVFSAVMQGLKTDKRFTIRADVGWRDCALEEAPGEWTIHWRRHERQDLRSVTVTVRVRTDSSKSAFEWMISVGNESPELSLRRVLFPQVAMAEPGRASRVLYPHGPGVVKKDAWRTPFQFQGRYPGGWVTMQLLAAYDDEEKRGLYVALHDPRGSTKEIRVQSRPDERSLRLAWEHPVPDMSKPKNSFRLSGAATWQLLRGDWFDAALIYRKWVRREARWYPDLGRDGRTDTPTWMKELPVWVLTGGAPGQCVPAVKEFAEYLGVPVGFHWYNWHQIPFDNDYPHYFPTKEGLRDGVRELQRAGVYVMPYINGRLWDTRDRGDEDFEFSRLARPAATRDSGGDPYVETYGSKEKDGSPVKLAVMCPATDLWQKKVRDIVLRLLDEEGMNAVYIDQIAAAVPQLCFDVDHGHPLGGGHWWIDGYEELLSAIRAAMPPERMLTTECTAESYVRWVDGYLSWDWQYDGQVPVLPAVYGGALQLFGRSYGAGPTRDLSLRMKAGQQLVFGEQIGWIHPALVKMEKSSEFLRQMVRLRWQLRRYFYAGEMARPPRLDGEIPEVRGDWQWHGEAWVTTDAVLTGAWALPREKKLALIFVNVGDQEIRARYRLDGKRFGVESDSLRVVVRTEEGPRDEFTVDRDFERPLELPAHKALVWELMPGE